MKCEMKLGALYVCLQVQNLEDKVERTAAVFKSGCWSGHRCIWV